VQRRRQGGSSWPHAAALPDGSLRQSLGREVQGLRAHHCGGHLTLCDTAHITKAVASQWVNHPSTGDMHVCLSEHVPQTASLCATDMGSHSSCMCIHLAHLGTLMATHSSFLLLPLPIHKLLPMVR
jgi:hypothetical protein